MSWWEALILGLVQGLTEFLPVSSSGHLEIGQALLGTAGEENAQCGKGGSRRAALCAGSCEEDPDCQRAG